MTGTAALSLSECLGGTNWLMSNILNSVVKTTALTGTTKTGGRVNAYNAVLAASQACPGTGDGQMDGTEQSRMWNGQMIYDSGTVSITVNGKTKTYSYGEYDTAYSIANTLESTINNGHLPSNGLPLVFAPHVQRSLPHVHRQKHRKRHLLHGEFQLHIQPHLFRRPVVPVLPISGSADGLQVVGSMVMVGRASQ